MGRWHSCQTNFLIKENTNKETTKMEVAPVTFLKMVKMEKVLHNINTKIFYSGGVTSNQILCSCIWKYQLHLSFYSLWIKKNRAKEENRFRNAKCMTTIYLLTMFKCQSMKPNMKAHFVSFIGASFLTRVCHFADPDSHIEVCESVAISDSTSQTVLGGWLWYWILFIGRAGVRRIDRPNRRIHYLLWGPGAAMWHEQRGSLLILKESECNFFF